MDCIYQSGYVDLACIFSVTDEDTGQRIITCLQAKSDIENLKENFLLFLKKELPNYMVPSEVFYLKEMPLTQSHKIDISLLRESYEKNELISEL